MAKAAPTPHAAGAKAAAGATAAAAGTPAAALDPLDLYAVRSTLSEEERLVQESVARLVDAEVLPLIQRCFEEHRFPKELIPKLASLGLLGSSLTGYECAGLNAICYGLICQELERGDSGIRSFVSVQSSLCMYPIWAFGSEEQKQRYLPRMARGELIGCFGLTEPHGGSDPANMKTHAKKRGGDWVVNGSKMWITNGSIADLALVWAMTPDGLRGFLIEKGTPGFSAPEIEHKFSLRASVTSALYFDNVEMRDDRTLLYASYLPAGVYEYRYLARATTPGTYGVLPAQAQLTYLPDVWGRSDSAQFTVTAK